MVLLTIAHHYIIWHYSRALKEIWHVARNLMWFVVHFFSLPQLFRAYFAPFRRITEDRGQSFSFEDLAGYIIINLISRAIGFILRTVIIVCGAGCLLILCVSTFLLYLLWLAAPLTVIGSLGFGIAVLLTA